VDLKVEASSATLGSEADAGIAASKVRETLSGDQIALERLRWRLCKDAESGLMTPDEFMRRSSIVDAALIATTRAGGAPVVSSDRLQVAITFTACEPTMDVLVDGKRSAGVQDGASVYRDTLDRGVHQFVLRKFVGNDGTLLSRGRDLFVCSALDVDVQDAVLTISCNEFVAHDATLFGRPHGTWACP
jgi:hypothetical protein